MAGDDGRLASGGEWSKHALRLHMTTVASTRRRALASAGAGILPVPVENLWPRRGSISAKSRRRIGHENLFTMPGSLARIFFTICC